MNEPKFYTEIEYLKHIIEKQAKEIQELRKIINNK